MVWRPTAQKQNIAHRMFKKTTQGPWSLGPGPKGPKRPWSRDRAPGPKGPKAQVHGFLVPGLKGPRPWSMGPWSQA